MLRLMIEVFLGKYQDNRTVLVDADKATVYEGEYEGTNLSLLTLSKDGEQVAWFEGWKYAVKVDNLMEYIDE